MTIKEITDSIIEIFEGEVDFESFVFFPVKVHDEKKKREGMMLCGEMTNSDLHILIDAINIILDEREERGEGKCECPACQIDRAIKEMEEAQEKGETPQQYFERTFQDAPKEILQRVKEALMFSNITGKSGISIHDMSPEDIIMAGDMAKENGDLDGFLDSLNEAKKEKKSKKRKEK